MNDVARGLVLTQLGNGLLRRLFTSYVHEPNFRTHFCRSNGKYCTSIGQVLVKEAGQNQLHLPVLVRITGVLYLSVPPLNSLSALQVAIRTLRMMGRFLDGKRNINIIIISFIYPRIYGVALLPMK